MTTFPQPAARRALGDVGNLINGKAPLANRKKPVVVAADKCVKVVPQAAARSRRALIDVSNLINGRPSLANRRQKVEPLVADRRGKAVKLKESNKPKPEVIVISSDSEKEKKASAGHRASRRARIQTLTSILTKCSRVRQCDLDHSLLNPMLRF
jgi:G2/mitotic-specific cyclin-B, other